MPKLTIENFIQAGYQTVQKGKEFIITPCPCCGTKNQKSKSAFFDPMKGFNCFVCQADTKEVRRALKIPYSTSPQDIKQPYKTQIKNKQEAKYKEISFNPEDEKIKEKVDRIISRHLLYKLKNKKENWTCTNRYLMTDYQGKHWGYFLRFKEKNNSNKEFRQIKYTYNVNEGYRFVMRAPQVLKENKPLYGYNKEKLEKCTVVYIVEGQKCQEALQAFIELNKAQTHALAIYGASSADKFDFSILKDKKVRILPDNDESGKKASTIIAKKLDSLGIPWDICPTLGKDKGYDIADWLSQHNKEGWDFFEQALKPTVQILNFLDPNAIIDPSEFPKIPELKANGEYKMIPSTLQNFEYLLKRYGIEIRKNITLKDIEIIDTQNRVKHIDFGTITSIMRNNNMPVSDLQVYYENIASNNEVNPVLNYFKEGAKKWDGIERLDNFIDHAFQYQTDDSLNKAEQEQRIANYKEMLKVWLLLAVHVQTEDQKKRPVREILILQGAEDLGKSSFFRNLMPKNKDWFGEVGAIDPSNSNNVHEIISKAMVESAEFEATMRKDLSNLKQFIARSTDSFRLPYGRKRFNFARTTIFCGTVNSRKFLKDDENTRFLVVPITKVNFKENNSITECEYNLQMLWGELYSLYCQIGYKGVDAMSREIKAKTKEEREEFKLGFSIEEIIVKTVQNPNKEGIYGSMQKLTAREIGETITERRITGSEEQWIGKFLSRPELGYTKKRIPRNGQKLTVYEVILDKKDWD